MSRKHREISRRWFRIGAYDEQMVKNRASRSARTAAVVAASIASMPAKELNRSRGSAHPELGYHSGHLAGSVICLHTRSHGALMTSSLCAKRSAFAGSKAAGQWMSGER